MTRVDRVAWDDPRAAALREAMTAEVSAMYADEPTLGNRDGSAGVEPDTVVACFVAVTEVPVGHVALRRIVVDGVDELEVKRMFVAQAGRGSGVADALWHAVVDEARRLGAHRLLLHTGDRQRAALAFYARHGCTPVPIYPPYEHVARSVCLEKLL